MAWSQHIILIGCFGMPECITLVEKPSPHSSSQQPVHHSPHQHRHASAWNTAVATHTCMHACIQTPRNQHVHVLKVHAGVSQGTGQVLFTQTAGMSVRRSWWQRSAKTHVCGLDVKIINIHQCSNKAFRYTHRDPRELHLLLHAYI